MSEIASLRASSGLTRPAPTARMRTGRLLDAPWVPVAVVLLTLCNLSPSVSRANGPCTVFRNVHIVDVRDGAVASERTVVVRGDRIRALAQDSDKHAKSACTVIDGQGRYLIPGLVDTHVHFFGYSGGGNGDAEAQAAVLRMLLANGITTAVVMEGTPEILALRSEIASGRVRGPRLYSTGPLIQAPGTGEPPGRRTFGTPEAIVDEIREEKRLGYDFVKVHGAMPAEVYAALLQTAREVGLRVVGHVPDNLGIDTALNGGQVMITHAESYLQTYFEFHRPLPSDPAEIDGMVHDISARTARAGVFVQPTLSVFRQIITQVAQPELLLQRPEMRLLPESQRHDWLPPRNPYLRRWSLSDLPRFGSQYGVMEKLVRGLRDAGVRLLVGTDDMVPMQLPGFSLRDEMIGLEEAGLTPAEVLRAATYNAAVFLRSENAGEIRVGAAADLVLLDANPLDEISNAFLQAGVMLQGQWLPTAELRAALWRGAQELAD